MHEVFRGIVRWGQKVTFNEEKISLKIQRNTKY